MTFTIIFFALAFAFAVAFGSWWLYKTIKQINENIKDIQVNKYIRLQSSLGKFKDEIKQNIQEHENKVKTHITSENKMLSLMIIKQLENQTSKLSKDIELSRRTLFNIAALIEELKMHTTKSINETTNKIGALARTIPVSISEASRSINTQIKDSYNMLSNIEQQKTAEIKNGIDMLFTVLAEFRESVKIELNNLIKVNEKNSNQLENAIGSVSNTLQIHSDKIISTCTKIINSENELHNKTKNSFDNLNIQLSKYLSQIKQIDLLYSDIHNLYLKLLDEEKRILKQETSLSEMVNKHAQIFELTTQMNKTTNEIFEFMKIYLLQSTLDNFK